MKKKHDCAEDAGRRRLRILHITGQAHGGSGVHILSLVRGCNPSRFEHSVAMSPDSPMQPDFESTGARIILLPIDARGSLYRNVLALAELISILRREQFDIIHTHTSVAAALGRVAARFTGNGITIHMMHNFASHKHVPWLKRTIYSAVERFLCYLTDYSIAGSRAVMEEGLRRKFFRPGRVSLIYNGVNEVRLASEASEGLLNVRKSLGIGADALLIEFLGRLERQKGAEVLIRAASKVCSKHQRAHFVIAGDGSERAKLESIARASGLTDRVHFLGWIAGVGSFLKQLDIFAMPSLWEPFGLAAAEASFFGVPIVASSVDGLCELVEDRSTGLLVPPEDADALADALIELALSPERRLALGAHARHRAHTQFSEAGMIAAHEKLYEEVFRKWHDLA